MTWQNRSVVHSMHVKKKSSAVADDKKNYGREGEEGG
jgi:hypothetical protein